MLWGRNSIETAIWKTESRRTPANERGKARWSSFTVPSMQRTSIQHAQTQSEAGELFTNLHQAGCAEILYAHQFSLGASGQIA